MFKGEEPCCIEHLNQARQNMRRYLKELVLNGKMG